MSYELIPVTIMYRLSTRGRLERLIQGGDMQKYHFLTDSLSPETIRLFGIYDAIGASYLAPMDRFGNVSEYDTLMSVHDIIERLREEERESPGKSD